MIFSLWFVVILQTMILFMVWLNDIRSWKSDNENPWHNLIIAALAALTPGMAGVVVYIAQMAFGMVA